MNTTTPRGAVAAPPPHTAARATSMVLAALLAGLLGPLSLASPSSAASYRYWSYWQGASGTWVAAQTGPGDYDVVDKDVQGWRFGITADSPTQTPDNAPDFATLCPDLAAGSAPAGQVRVAVVVDAGFVADAPSGQTPPADAVSCVTVPEGSTGNQALAAAVKVTDQGGLVCALNGYPADECGAEVPDADASVAAAAAASESPNPAAVGAADSAPAAEGGSGPGAALWLGLAAVAALLVGVLVAGRRRSAQTPQ